MSVQRDARSIALEEGAALDFGGIGKGYAVDRALAILRARGVRRAKLDFGSSSIGFVGSIPGAGRSPSRIRAIATGHCSASGSRRRRQHLEPARAVLRVRGRRYGHIFDPRLGRPVDLGS